MSMIKRRGLLAAALIFGYSALGYGGETNSQPPSVSSQIFTKLQEREPGQSYWDKKLRQGDTEIVRYRVYAEGSLISVKSFDNDGVPVIEFVVDKNDCPIQFYIYSITEIGGSDRKSKDIIATAYPENNPRNFQKECLEDLAEINNRVSALK